MPDDERTLGGSGNLNLPYEDVPSGPIYPYREADHLELSGGVVLLGAVIPHPVHGRPHPAIIFRFMRPDGVAYPDRLLVVESEELTALGILLRDTIEGAHRGAQREGG